MKKKLKKSELFSRVISFEDNLILPDFFGSNDENLKKLENAFGVSILPRGNFLKIEGLQENVEHTYIVLKKLYEGVKKNKFLSSSDIDTIIKIFKNQNYDKPIKEYEVIESSNIVAGRKIIKPRSKKQLEYFNLVKEKQMVFCCGPAGTGKTYLAVAYAVSMLKSGEIDKIILTLTLTLTR